MLDNFSLIIGGLYFMQGRFSALPGFMNLLPKELFQKDYSPNQLINQISSLQANLSNEAFISSHAAALKKLISIDLSGVGNLLSEDLITKAIFDEADYEVQLKSCRNKAISLLRLIEIEIEEPEIFIVENFPHPYERSDYDALTVDISDYKKYGIEAGIYFKKSNLRPFLSKHLLVHELIHVA